MKTQIDPKVYDILKHAAMASSGHNTQPWKVTITDDTTFELYMDTERQLPAVDPNNRELYLSLGAFLGNLKVAATAHGMTAAVQPQAKSTEDEHAATITLQNGHTADEQILETIKNRCTLRANYKNDEIRSTDLDSIIAPAPDRFGFFPKTSANGRYLNEIAYEANKTQVNRRETQVELAEWIHWAKDEAEKHRDGLTPATMEIDGVAGWIVHHFFNEKSVLKPSFAKTTLKMMEDQLASHGGWLIMTSAETTPSALLETGDFYQQMLLNIRKRNIAVHPISQILEETPFKNDIQHQLGLTDSVQFVLRLGYLEHYKPRASLRRPVEWFTTA